MVAFFSQDKQTCGDDVEWACGAVSLANSFVLRGIRQVSPMSIIQCVKSPTLKERRGLAPSELCALATSFVKSTGLVGTLQHPCSVGDVRPGDLIYVSSIALKNSQGLAQYEDSIIDSHVVLVERVSREGVVVINPDCRNKGRSFQHDVWGRMVIPYDKLESVWRSVRVDGSVTLRAAVQFHPSPGMDCFHKDEKELKRR